MSDTRRLLLEFETEKVGRLAGKDPRVRKALVSAFSDSSETIRERALLAAIELGDPSIVDDGVKALYDEEVDVRIAAAQLLAWYQQPKTIPDLLNGLTDSNTWVRSHCAKGISKLLHGPIWARLPEEDIDKFRSDFPDMIEEEIREYMINLKIESKAIDQYMRWRKEGFDVEIDFSEAADLIEGDHIILPDEDRKETREARPKTKGLSEGVEGILDELPDEIRSSLPVEDLRRLTPKTARELVDSLMDASPKEKKKAPKKEGKKVKVRRVKKVKRVRKGPTKEELIQKLPADVRESVTDEVLSTLAIEELEALLSESSMDGTEEGTPEADKETGKSKSKKKGTEEPVDSRFQELSEKYGEEKAEILMEMPEDIISGIPEDQIKEMDIETLKGLFDAV